MKLIKKIIIVLSILLMLVSCANKTDYTLKDSSYYLNELENYTPRDKNINATIDDASFDEFQDEVFKKYLEKDYIEMRSFVVDYKAFDVCKPDVNWGKLIYQDYSDAVFYNNFLVDLKQYDFNSLSYSQQFEYEKLEYYLLEKICSTYYKEYNPIFSYSNDFLGYLFFNLDELPISSEEYIGDYLLLLEDYPRYINEALVFVEKQADNKVYADNDSLDYNLDYIVELLGNDNGNDFINSFNNKIDKLDFIDETKKQEYKDRNNKIVEESIVGCLQDLSEQLLNYYDLADNDNSFQCDYSNDYARFMLMYNTSSNIDPQTLFDLTLADLNKIGEEYKQIMNDESLINEQYEIYNSDTYGGLGLSDKETLDYLEENINTFVPKLDEYKYEISRLESTNEGSSTIAYHIAPAIDNPDGTIIRTNPLMFGYDYISDYVVVAHEGLPGHMYQNLYYLSTSPANITGIYQYIGYKEGWATYSMLEALKQSGIKSEALLTYQKLYWMLDYYMCALGDIHFNYMDKSLEEFEQILDDNGWNYEYATAIKDIVRKNPGTNLSYGIGYMQFITLRNKAEDALGDQFDIVSFNEELLKHGPLPMVVLNKAIDDYIEINK